VNNTQRVIAVVAAALVFVAAIPAGAASDKELRAVRGVAGYRASADAPFNRVVGRIALGDDAVAVTQVASNALLTLPDSSEVALGANTSVQVGAFNDASAPTPTTLTLRSGALRFNVRHPAGGRSNFRFATVTSQIAVRGTVGLFQTGPNGDVIACLDCAAGDVVVTVGTQTFALLTGQTLFVSLAGVVTTATAAAAASAFSGSGLTTDLAARTAFTGSIGGGAAAAAAPALPPAALPIAGGVFAAGAATAIITTNNRPTSAPATPAPTPTVTLPPAVVVPTPSPAPATGTGSATLTGAGRKHP
jgi:hypothetical protein